MAFSKNAKQDMQAQYEQWLKESHAVFLVEYSRLSMKDINDVRAKIREVGGQAHVVKNTLMERALTNAKIDFKGEIKGTSLAGFALDDIPAMAKVLDEVTEKSEFLSLKYGFMDGKLLSVDQIKTLGKLPPLPVMRATLLGTIMAPASKLVRTIAEPSRMVAAVIKAYSEKDAATTEAQ